MIQSNAIISNQDAPFTAINAIISDNTTGPKKIDQCRLALAIIRSPSAVSLNCILLIFLTLKFISQFKIIIYMPISILYKMNALLISVTIPSGEDARTVSPKIRLIDEKKPSTAHRLPY